MLLPRNNKELAEVREEAEFYQLNELARQCDSIWIVQYNKGPREMLRRIAGSKKVGLDLKKNLQTYIFF